MSRFLLLFVAAALALLGAGCASSEEASPHPVPQASAPPPPASVTEAAATTAASPTGSANGVPRCTTADLKGSLGTGDAAAGSVYRPLLLTNTSNRTCELVGFPGVSYVTGDNGRQVGPAAEMDGARGKQVNLKPGAAASATVRMVNVDNFDAAQCKPVEARGLRVYPPGDTASLFVPFDGGRGCSITPPQPQLFVATVKPAA